MPILRALVSVFIFFLLATSTLAGPTVVKVDFDSFATYKETDGRQYMAMPSRLLPDTRAAIIAKAQAKFDTALGAGNIMVMEGTGGNMNIIMSGTTPRKYG